MDSHTVKRLQPELDALEQKIRAQVVRDTGRTEHVITQGDITINVSIEPHSSHVRVSVRRYRPSQDYGTEKDEKKHVVADLDLDLLPNVGPGEEGWPLQLVKSILDEE